MTAKDRAIFGYIKGLKWDHDLWVALRSEIGRRRSSLVIHHGHGGGRPRSIDRERVMRLIKDHTVREVADILQCHAQSIRNILGGRQ